MEGSPSVADETVDMPMAPMSMPPQPEDETSPPAVDIHEGRFPPANPSPPDRAEERGNEGPSSSEFGLVTSALFPW